MSNQDLKLKSFNWINYLKPFFFKELVDHFKTNMQQIQTIGFLNFLAGIYHEFGIGHKVDREKALKYYQNSQQDPFCAYRLAEIYCDPCHYNNLIEPDFQQSWIHLLFSSALTLSADPMQSIEAMKKIYEKADQYLENSKHLLLTNFNFPEKNIHLILINLIKLKILNDKVEETKCFQFLLQNINSFELLFTLNITQNRQENTQLNHIMLNLAKRKDDQLTFIQTQNLVYNLTFQRLPHDHELFFCFRYKIFEFYNIRQAALKISPKTELDQLIDENLLILFKALYEISRPKLKDPMDQIFIIRYYTKLLQKTSQELDKIQEIQREELNYKVDENYHAYTYYRLGSIGIKNQQDRSNFIKDLKIAQSMFMERLNNSSSVLDKFISTYFLGRISKKLEDDNKVNNEQILTPHSDSLPTSIDISPASNNQQYEQNDQYYFQQALLLYHQHQTQFYYVRTFQFELFLLKLKKRYSTKISYEPQINFFSINTLSQSQKIKQKQSLNSLKSSRTLNQSFQISHKDFQLKSLIKISETTKLYSSIIKVNDDSISCYTKLFCGLKNSFELLNALNQWNGLNGLNPIIAISSQQLENDSEQVLLAYQVQDNNLYSILNCSLSEKINYSLKIVQIIEEIHNRNLIHGNLKPTNILITKSEVFITDYCWPIILWSEDEFTDRHFEYGYSEKEFQKDKKTDIWSLGVILLQIFSYSVLNANILEQMQVYEEKKNTSLLEDLGLVKINDLVKKMLFLDRNKRITIKNVVSEIKNWTQN